MKGRIKSVFERYSMYNYLKIISIYRFSMSISRYDIEINEPISIILKTYRCATLPTMVLNLNFFFYFSYFACWLWGYIHRKFIVLTIPGHADCQAFFESAVLTPIPVQSDHQTFAVPQTPIFDLFLYTPPEEPLQQTFFTSFIAIIIGVNSGEGLNFPSLKI